MLVWTVENGQKLIKVHQNENDDQKYRRRKFFFFFVALRWVEFNLRLNVPL